MRVIVFGLLLSTNPCHLQSQSYPIREYGVSDGLPQSQIHGIYQDSRGFLWIITMNGLSRYDGFEFVNYFRTDGLPSNFVNYVMEDSTGTIWVVAPKGLSKYNGSRFEYFPPPGELKSFLFGKAFEFNGNLLLSASHPYSPYKRFFIFRDGVYSDYSAKFPALDTLQVSNIEYVSGSDNIFIIDLRGFIYTWKNNELTQVSSRKFSEITTGRNEIQAFVNDTIYRINDNKSLVAEIFPYGETPSVRLRNDKTGLAFDLFDGTHVTNLSFSFNPLGYFLDKEGCLWIKSENNMFRLLSTSFCGFSDDDIGAMNLWAIAEDRNGHILFGSLYGALFEYDGTKFTEITEHKLLFSSEPGFYKGSRRMSNGDIWFSTNMGIAVWNGKNFSRLKSIPDPNQICYIYEDPLDKSILVGAASGLFVIRGDSVSHFIQFNDSEYGVIEGITRLENGKYLLSGHRGLVDFDGVNAIPLREKILPEVNTYTLEKDNLGGIWVTSEEGLFFRRNSAEPFVHGLPESINRAANSICLMDGNHILVGRSSDICVIDLEKFYGGDKEYFRLYDKSDGFEGSDCIDNGIIKDHRGRFWILTSNSAIRFDPSKLRLNTSPPKLHITGLHFQNDSLEWEPFDINGYFYEVPDIIRINSRQSKIQIAFTGISTTNPEKLLMQYRLTGIDDNWSSPSSKRMVIYEKLPPGNYQFELKGTNADGFETAEPIIMKLKVLPTIWQTLFFKILFILVILGITIAITTTIQTRRHRKKAEEEKLRSELSNLQMSSILRQFDPHFTFNVISSVGSLILKGEKEVAYEYITKLSVLLRTVLSDGSFIIRPVSEELDFVRRYCELQKLRFKERFNFQIKIDGNIDLQRKIPKMTIQTFVENAIKHGFDNRKEGGKVTVTVRKTENNLEILIADDGVGRNEASRQRTGGTGNGIKIVIGLIERMNSRNPSDARLDIRDLLENGRPSGTEVRILIPDDYTFDFEGYK